MKIGAIIVTYNIEDSEDLCRNVNSLLTQVDSICIIDNSDIDSSHIFRNISGVHYIALKKNAGIAAAQNIGIEYYLKEKADFILFSDQDSLVPQGAVEGLLTTYKKLNDKGLNPGAVGSRAYNKQNNVPYPHSINQIDTFMLDSCTSITEVAYTMNSISLIPTKHFKEIGGMDEMLFIDGVDCEWCWRAKKKKGYRFFVDENIHIMHLLGNGVRKIGNKSISITPPYRMFFQYRNYFWLAKRDYTPKKWVLHNGFKYFVKIFYYGILYSNRKAYLVNIFKGIKQGLKQ